MGKSSKSLFVGLDVHKESIAVAYAPDEVFIMLSLAGASAYVWSWKIAIAVALVMAAVMIGARGNRLVQRRLLGIPIGMFLHLVLDVVLLGLRLVLGLHDGECRLAGFLVDAEPLQVSDQRFDQR